MVLDRVLGKGCCRHTCLDCSNPPHIKRSTLPLTEHILGSSTGLQILSQQQDFYQMFSRTPAPSPSNIAPQQGCSPPKTRFQLTPKTSSQPRG